MYQAFYGLSRAPFALNHDPAFVFDTERQTQARRHVEDGLSSGRPLTLLLGHPGLGKTTILRTALESERCRELECLYLPNPTAHGVPFAETLLAELQPGTTPIAPPGLRLQALHALLMDRRSRGIRSGLVIDESESLSDEALADVSTLIAMQSDKSQVLPVVLAGLPALRSRLDRSPMRQWVAAAPSLDLAPLDLSQTASYILWRARAAGGTLFTREAVALIHQYAAGVPRTISVICDNTLLTGSWLKQKPVTRQVVADVCSRLDLAVESSTAAAGRSPTDEGRRTKNDGRRRSRNVG